jgi:hypothetical protein
MTGDLRKSEVTNKFIYILFNDAFRTQIIQRRVKDGKRMMKWKDVEGSGQGQI